MLHIENVGEKSQDNNKLILHNTIIMQDETKFLIRCRGFYPPSRKFIQINLDEFQSFPILNNTTVPIKKGSRWYEWLTAEEKSYKNDSITYFNARVDNSFLDAEGNTCGIITILSIESTPDNDYIYVLNDIPKYYIYG